MSPPPPRSTLFPYTTLFRSVRGHGRAVFAVTPVNFLDNALAPVSRKFTGDRKSTRLNSSHVEISYAVFCLKKKKVKRVMCDHGARQPRAKPRVDPVVRTGVA